jgi:hypothetical protein
MAPRRDGHGSDCPADLDFDPDARSGLDARRADALADLVLGRAQFPGKGPLIQVTVSADTLLGIDEKPGELAGYGPITAAAARHVAAGDDATWRRILTDPRSGIATDVGRTRYRPPAALAELVKVRDRVCRHPSCQVPASHCDLDHLRPYPAGPTAADNLVPLCRRHHLIKTHVPGWSMHRDPDGTVWTVTPTGHRYADRPRAADPPDGPDPPF